MESILIALKLTGLGLGGVFVSLILLYIAIRATANRFKKKPENEEVHEGRGEQ
jgi:Na+-transporting methylmalonyl-CoA/oxaloacetate decarboxylase gamma subunit